jgi:hypothetical protein
MYGKNVASGENMTTEEKRLLNELLDANIGFLRQWLNEDRITEPKKMVTNEELKYWLIGKV